MKDKYGVTLEVGDIVVVNSNSSDLFERGIIEEIEEHKVMGLVIAETAVVNWGYRSIFTESEIIYVEWGIGEHLALLYFVLNKPTNSTLQTSLRTPLISHYKHFKHFPIPL